jgi:hypothetical protein
MTCRGLASLAEQVLGTPKNEKKRIKLWYAFCFWIRVRVRVRVRIRN